MIKLIKISSAVFILLLILFVFISDSGGISIAVVKSVETCLYTIIPALFGFMALSSYLLNSGLYKIIFKPIYITLRYIIKLDEEEFSIFLLSLFGGYPVGAKLLFEKYSRGGYYRDILPYCYCPSPGFVVTVVGLSLFRGSDSGLALQIGLAVYMSNVLSCVILAVLLNLKNKKKITQKSVKFSLNLSQDTFISSVMSAASSLFPVCVMIIIFGIIIEILKFCGINQFLTIFGENTSAVFFAVTEISNIASLPRDITLLPAIAAIFSFGGFCIIMQIPALTKGKLPLKRFLLWRIPAAALSSLICSLIISNLNLPVPATASEIFIPTQTQSPISSVALFIMSLILIKTSQDSVRN